ncbi:MAG TPA: protein translocase subunit SecF [Terriglobales bacterium]|nr:protein translocase subunit SecF [Terriglobales bacterium]
MEFFRNPNIDFLGKKWYFLAFSLVFSVAGILSMLFWHGIPLGVDFRGGTLVRVKFTHSPDINEIRALMDRAGLHSARIQRFGPPANNEVLIGLAEKETSEAALDQGRAQIINALETRMPAGKQDLNNASGQTIQSYLLSNDPLHLGTDAAQRYQEMAQAVVHQRDAVQSGVLYSMNDLKGIVPPPVQASLSQGFGLADFGVRNVDVVGPQVGKQLQNQAKLAILYSLIGMLVYLWFRFELIYGVAAVVACFHDTLITVGAFSLANKEISLTVIAAILTLVGYSMNDTIVVFDRIRENIKLLRREKLADIVNRSINQTLSRTVLTSGLTFLTVLSLYLFGGEVLRGFSFALVIGIIIGTYSSIAVAAPMLVAYQDWRTRRGASGRPMPPAAPTVNRREKVRAKA